MNSFSISMTPKGTKEYPLHSHDSWEIMYYLEGNGRLKTENGGIPFSAGTIIIVPPKTVHGSSASDGFRNISVGGDFGHLFMFDRIVTEQDNGELDGRRLAGLIFDNRHEAPEYLAALSNAYAHFLLKNLKYEGRISRAVTDIIKTASREFFDPCFDITKTLNGSGYTEDYIRSKFKEYTGLSPIDFLTKIRIDHARWLFEIYGQAISVGEVAEACGFDDSVYFSKRFKQLTGLSPKGYQKQFI